MEPRFIENRDFVELEEEDIHQLNQTEAAKFNQNTNLRQIMEEIENELGQPGWWEEHWLTVDASGRRVYARIYYANGRAAAIAANGHVVKEIAYPVQ